ncbi:hypothetical protein X740_13955 [Mesorhizobium sp. LNHC221B00]|nr:hypothetical protein X740_13955 [Mesorhizobium sp. LNHC221B00]
MTKAPSGPATVAPSTVVPLRISTFELGAALPATTIEPLPSTRTTSNVGAIGPAAAGAAGAGASAAGAVACGAAAGAAGTAGAGNRPSVPGSAGFASGGVKAATCAGGVG